MVIKDLGGIRGGFRVKVVQILRSYIYAKDNCRRVYKGLL